MSAAHELVRDLEEGLLLLSRGMVYDARETWRRILISDPKNAIALDYLVSTDCELNPYERQREAKLTFRTPLADSSDTQEWLPEVDVVAVGSAEDDEDAMSTAPSFETGFQMAEESLEDGGSGVFIVEAEEAGPENGHQLPPWSGSSHSSDFTSELIEPLAIVEAEGAEEEFSELFGETTAGAIPTPTALPPQSLPIEAETDLTDSEDTWEIGSLFSEDTLPPAARSSHPRSSVDSRTARPISAAPFTPTMPNNLHSAAAADSLSGSLAAAPASAASSIDSLLENARREAERQRWDRARDLLLQASEQAPDNREVSDELRGVTSRLILHYEAKLGRGTGVLALNRPLTELYSLDIDQIGGYLLSRIDGYLTLDDIYAMSAHLDRLVVMRILTEFSENNIVSIH